MAVFYSLFYFFHLFFFYNFFFFVLGKDGRGRGILFFFLLAIEINNQCEFA